MSFYKNKRVLVTGGCGLIGSYLSELLVSEKADTTISDSLSRGSLDRIKSIKDDVELRKLDLLDYSNCLKACEKQDVVMNLAAQVTGIEYNRTHNAETFINNMTLAQNMLKAAVECGVKRFLLVSTACVYPHDAVVPTPESEGERDEPEPTNSGYGWAKRMSEKLGKYYAQESDMEIAIARPFNAYGLRDHFDVKTSHVIPALIKRICDGEDPLVVWGSGNQSRVFVHAKDIAKGMMLLTEKYAKSDPVNIGHDKEVTIRELVDLISELSGRNPEIVYDTSKPDGYPRRAADTTKLKAVSGGWVPDTPLKEGLAEMVEYYEKTK